jgi:hypothetical protein
VNLLQQRNKTERRGSETSAATLLKHPRVQTRAGGRSVP